MVDQPTNGPLAAPGRNHTGNHAGLSLCGQQQSLSIRPPLSSRADDPVLELIVLT